MVYMYNYKALVICLILYPFGTGTLVGLALATRIYRIYIRGHHIGFQLTKSYINLIKVVGSSHDACITTAYWAYL